MNPWHFEAPDGKPIVGHYLNVQAIGDEIVAQVCLLMTVRYTITLARGGVLLPASFGHLFDRSTGHALAMPVALPLEPGARSETPPPLGGDPTDDANGAQT
jgi:hypothetical protein